MTPLERIIAVFRRAPRDRVPWNIRPESWYLYNRARGSLPAKYRGMSLVDICREWGASWRCYQGFFTERFVRVWYEGDVEIKVRRKGRLTMTNYD